MAAATAADVPPRRWRGAAAGLAAAVVALGVALLVPRLFSDPVGVDPFAARLGAVAAVLLAVCALWARAREARPVVLAVAAIAVPFTLWAAAPDAALRIAGDRLSWQERVLTADCVYMLTTALFAVAAVWWLAPDERPALRLRAFPPRAAASTLGLLALLVVVGLAVPAGVLGRMGVQPVALARDLPLLGPAYLLQAAAQEVQFRGLLLGILERRMPAWAAVGGQALFFGFAHIAVQYEGPAGPFVPVTVALGLVLGVVTRWTRSLWPAIVVHGLAEVAVPVAILDGLYGF